MTVTGRLRLGYLMHRMASRTPNALQHAKARRPLAIRTNSPIQAPASELVDAWVHSAPNRTVVSSVVDTWHKWSRDDWSPSLASAVNPPEVPAAVVRVSAEQAPGCDHLHCGKSGASAQHCTSLALQPRQLPVSHPSIIRFFPSFSAVSLRTVVFEWRQREGVLIFTSKSVFGTDSADQWGVSRCSRPESFESTLSAPLQRRGEEGACAEGQGIARKLRVEEVRTRGCDPACTSKTYDEGVGIGQGKM